MSDKHSKAGRFNTPKPLELTQQDKEKFERNVDRTPGQGPNGDCHTWTGGKNSKGYGHMKLSNGRTARAPRVGYVVYYGEDPYPFLVRHTCDYEPCVRGEHLKKGTQQENRQDSVERGRTATGDRNGSRTHPERLARGEDHWTAKNPGTAATKHAPEKINAIRKLHLTRPELSLRAVAKYFGMPPSTIKQIINGETWGHLPYDESVEIPLPIDPDYDVKRRLNSAMARAIRQMSEDGISQSKIAVLFQIDQTMVSAIVRGEAWSNDV